MSVLSIRTIFLVLAVAGAAIAASDSDDCWLKSENYKYSGLLRISVSTYGKCRAHCFDLDQLLGTCSVFNWVYDEQCHRALNSDKPDPKSAVYSKEINSYFLKDECRGDGCWSKVSGSVTGLNVTEAENERHCKFICLENEDCFFYAYDNNICYIQDPVVHEGTFEHGQVYMLNNLCKKESCWKRMNNKDSALDQLKPQSADSDFDCRVKCMEKYICQAYKWNKITGECHIMSEPSGGQVSYSDKEGVVSYLYKPHCFIVSDYFY